jgi:hypothetical protein
MLEGVWFTRRGRGDQQDIALRIVEGLEYDGPLEDLEFVNCNEGLFRKILRSR